MKMPVIHPELVLGFRGNRLAQQIIAQLMVAAHDGSIRQNAIFNHYTKDYDEEAKQAAIIGISTWASVAKTKKIYGVGKAFFRAISRLDRDLPVELIPDKFVGYIAFPFQDELYWSGGGFKDPFVGMYVFLEKDGDRILIAVYPLITDKKSANDQTLDPAPMPNTLHGIFNTKSGMIQMKGIQSKVSGEDETNTKRLILAALNLVAYINTGDPDISWMAPKKGVGVKERKEKAAKGTTFSEDLTIPIRVVSWNWQKPPQYTAEEWERTGHWRWQRYGPGFTQFRMIFIAPTKAKRRKPLVESGED